jgi:hypothetical protein
MKGKMKMKKFLYAVAGIFSAALLAPNSPAGCSLAP